jgi:hypothetical protein
MQRPSSHANRSLVDLSRHKSCEKFSLRKEKKHEKYFFLLASIIFGRKPRVVIAIHTCKHAKIEMTQKGGMNEALVGTLSLGQQQNRHSVQKIVFVMKKLV